MSALVPNNSTKKFFKNLESEGKVEIVHAYDPVAWEAMNARLEKMRKETIERLRLSRIDAEQVYLNA